MAAEPFVLPLYYINLDRSTERKEMFERMIKEEQERLNNVIVFDVKRISAIDGHELDVTSVFKGGAPKPDAGCTVSHVNVAKEIVKNKDEVALVCEDDAFLNLSWNPQLFLEQLRSRPDDLQIWQLCINSMNIEKGAFWPHKENNWGTCCYLITQRGAAEQSALLDSKRRFFPADMLLYKHSKTYGCGFPWARWIPKFVSTIHPSHDANNSRVLKLSIQWLEKVHGKNGLERALEFK